MKILFVYQFCSLGGCETVLRNRLVGFRERGLAPHVVLLRDVGGGRIFAGFANVKYPCDSEELEAIVRRGSFDCIAAIDTPQIYPVLARTGFAGTLVTEVHSNRMSNVQYLHHLRDAAPHVLVTPSRFEGQLIEREFPAVRAAAVPIRVVPNPVDTTLFRPTGPAIAPPRPLVGWVGRLEPEKNWRLFLTIAAELARARDDVDFLVVGGWAVTDQAKRDFLAAVKDAALIDRLRWVSSLSYEQMPRFYGLLAASGGCLLPTSLFEPFGMSLVEAMACGCPVVAARAGGFREIVEEERTGLTFEPDDARDGAMRVSALLDDGALRVRLVENALEAVSARFAPAPVVDRYLAVVAEATARRTAAVEHAS